MSYQYCDTGLDGNIRVIGSCRQFKSLESLIASNREGAARFWWDGTDCVVAFPDKKHCSAAYVEVSRNEVRVGTPNNYLTFRLGSAMEALRWAENMNKKWLVSELSEDEFLATIS